MGQPPGNSGRKPVSSADSRIVVVQHPFKPIDTETDVPAVEVTQSVPVRVLLVAMHRLTQAGYRLLEETDPGIHIEAIADSAPAALEAVNQRPPDVLVVDLSDERLSGCELIPTLMATHPHLHLLAVSGHEDVLEAEVALQGGAAGYVCRSAPIEEIIRAVRVVASGGNYLDPAMAQRIALQKLMGKSSSLRVLSPREYEVFCMLAEGIPIKEIARRLNLNQKTVANYGGAIKAKLKVRSREELRAFARRTGVLG